MEIIVKNVGKTIKKKVILENVNLTLENGCIYGLVGTNGSGKTMLFRAISGLMKVSEGEIICDGKRLHKDIEMLPEMGIMIENAGLYPELSGFDNLQLLARLNGKIGKEEICRAIERVGLDPLDRRNFGKYSLGMKRRIVLAQAIMEQPQVLLLDEPTNALDEDGVEEVRKVLLEERERGALILIASHNKEDINLLADKVFVVKQGAVTERTEQG